MVTLGSKKSVKINRKMDLAIHATSCKNKNRATLDRRVERSFVTFRLDPPYRIYVSCPGEAETDAEPKRIVVEGEAKSEAKEEKR